MTMRPLTREESHAPAPSGVMEKIKPPMSRLRERIVENALEASGQPDAKRTQEWLIALQMLEQVEEMRKREPQAPSPAPEEASHA